MTTPPRPVIALFLPDAANEYQEMVRDDASRAATRAGLDFVPHSAGNSAASSPAQARLVGLKQGLEGSTVAIAAVLDGNWTSEDAEKAAGDWLLLMLRAGRQNLTSWPARATRWPPA